MGSFTQIGLAGLFWLATLPGANAETGSPVEVATTEIPGFIEAGDDGLTGAYVELLEAASERSGTAHEVRLMPWVRAVRRVDREAGVFILPFSRTEEREDRYQWAIRLREIRNGFVTLADPIDSLDEARSLDRVLVWRGTSHEVYLEEAGFENLFPVSSADTIRELMTTGRAVAWFSMLDEAGPMIGALPPEQALAIGAAISTESIWLATGLETDLETHAQFLTALDELVEQGFLTERLTRPAR